MNRNPKSMHLKRIAAPKHWLLDKLSGVWAPRPSPGPHKIRECLPIIIMLRNRLKYALTAREVKMIVLSRHIRVDGKVRTDTKFPCGFQDVVTINKTAEHFRLVYDVKGRFNLMRIPADEASWKLLKIVKKGLGARAIPYIVSHDGRTIPYPDPEIKIGDTIKYDFMKGKILGAAHFQKNAIVMITGGHNIGRVGSIEKIERHPGSFDIVHVRDSKDNHFSTRRENIFVLGKGKSWVSLPKTSGIKPTVIQDRQKRLDRNEKPNPNQNDKKKLAGKATVLPPRVGELRKATNEKKKLLKILQEQEKKNQKEQPNKTGKKGKVISKKAQKKATKAANANNAAAGGDAAQE